MSSRVLNSARQPLPAAKPAEAKPLPSSAPATAQEPGAATGTDSSFVNGGAQTQARNQLKGAVSEEAVPTSKRRGTEPYVEISSHDDDPMAAPSVIERLPRDAFLLGPDGNPIGLEGKRLKIIREDVLYVPTPDGSFAPAATNPWKLARPNEKGAFVYAAEPRFPLHAVERDEKGRPKTTKDGLQIWSPRELYRGQTTAFEAAYLMLAATERTLGRPMSFEGPLPIQTQAFIGFNAFFANNPPEAGGPGLFFGLVFYQAPGETQIRIFETASSMDIAGHEMGHFIHHLLKPNILPGDLGFGQWGESFGDQIVAWESLRDPERVAAVLEETSGDLYQSNSVTQLGEVFARLTGQGTALRDGFHEKTISDTSEEVHDRSEVLTGAAYKVFVRVYQDLVETHAPAQAITIAADMMQTMLLRAAEHTPENSLTLEDVGKAYLKVDKEYFGGQYAEVWNEEFTKREVFQLPTQPDPDRPALFEMPTRASVTEWLAHEDALPKLVLSPKNPSPAAAEALVKASLSKLGIGAGLDLKLQSHEVDDRGQQIVRVQLTDERSGKSQPVGNHGVMVFRKDGSLMDYHSPLPPGMTSERAAALIDRGRGQGLDAHGAPMSLVRDEAGGFTVKSFVPVSEKAPLGVLDFTEFSLEHPKGTLLKSHVHSDSCGHAKRARNALPEGARILSAAQVLEAFG